MQIRTPKLKPGPSALIALGIAFASGYAMAAPPRPTAAAGDQVSGPAFCLSLIHI